MGGGGSKPKKSLATRRMDRRINKLRGEEAYLLRLDDSNNRWIKKYKNEIPDKKRSFNRSYHKRTFLQSEHKILMDKLRGIQTYVRDLEKQINSFNKQRDDAKRLTKDYKAEISKLNDIIRALNVLLVYLKRIERAVQHQIDILDRQLNDTSEILEDEMTEFFRLDAYIKDLFFKVNTAKPLAEKYGQVYYNSLQQQNNSLISSKFELNNIQTRSNRLYLYSDYWYNLIDSVYDYALLIYLIIAVIAGYLAIYKSTYLTNNYYKMAAFVLILAFPFYIIPLEQGIIDFFRILISLFLGEPYEKKNWI
jgi:chromosome segregation ATPase